MCHETTHNKYGIVASDQYDAGDLRTDTMWPGSTEFLKKTRCKLLSRSSQRLPPPSTAQPTATCLSETDPRQFAVAQHSCCRQCVLSSTPATLFPCGPTSRDDEQKSTLARAACERPIQLRCAVLLDKSCDTFP